ncbi:MAG: transcriptional regulator [Proteobacteria bacterium]|nr:MAG: transcriptional regulator [Pseudomonadota bacterium]
MKEFEHPSFETIKLSDVLSALGDPIRLAIMAKLHASDQETGWGTFEVAVGKATLSHHMKTLRMSGLIRHRKEGTRCFVAIRPELNDVYPGLLDSVLRASKRDQAMQIKARETLVAAQ